MYKQYTNNCFILIFQEEVGNSTSLRLTNSSELLNHPYFKLGLLLNKYILPVIIIFGTIGNLASIAVLTRPKMRSNATYFYLTSLAVADTLVLYVSGLKSWIRILTNIELLHTSNLSCKTFSVLFFFSLHTSAWFVLLVTADRFFAVICPLKIASFSSVSRARKMAAFATILIATYSSPLIFDITLVQKGNITIGCWKRTAFMKEVYPYFKLVTYSIIPFTAVFIMNIVIILVIARKTIEKTVQNSQNNQYKLIIMLLAVSFAWLLLSTPFSIYPFLFSKEKTPENKARKFLVKTICFLLVYLNSSINFYIYCITGQKFRGELRNLFCPRWNSPRGSTGTVRTRFQTKLHRRDSREEVPLKTIL